MQNICPMKGISTVAANLANRVNQQHYIESELRKLFFAGVKFAQENPVWISVKDELPEIPEGKYSSENVFAIVDGMEDVQVMAFCFLKDDDNKWCHVWCNAYGDINGDAHFDDNYEVIKWSHIPKNVNE